ncbi:hypothetical protein D3C86_1859200 [compost metagenome]
MLAMTGNDAGSQHVVANRAGPRSAWPRQAGGDHATKGGTVIAVRWFARQHLPGGVQRCVQFGQQRAGACRDHQFRRVIGNNAAMRTSIEQLTAHHATQMSLAVPSLDAQRNMAAQGMLNLLQEVRASVVGMLARH